MMPHRASPSLPVLAFPGSRKLKRCKLWRVNRNFRNYGWQIRSDRVVAETPYIRPLAGQDSRLSINITASGRSYQAVALPIFIPPVIDKMCDAEQRAVV